MPKLTGETIARDKQPADFETVQEVINLEDSIRTLALQQNGLIAGSIWVSLFFIMQYFTLSDENSAYNQLLANNSKQKLNFLVEKTVKEVDAKTVEKMEQAADSAVKRSAIASLDDPKVRSILGKVHKAAAHFYGKKMSLAVIDEFMDDQSPQAQAYQHGIKLALKQELLDVLIPFAEERKKIGMWNDNLERDFNAAHQIEKLSFRKFMSDFLIYMNVRNIESAVKQVDRDAILMEEGTPLIELLQNRFNILSRFTRLTRWIIEIPIFIAGITASNIAFNRFRPQGILSTHIPRPQENILVAPARLVNKYKKALEDKYQTNRKVIPRIQWIDRTIFLMAFMLFISGAWFDPSLPLMAMALTGIMEVYCRVMIDGITKKELQQQKNDKAVKIIFVSLSKDFNFEYSNFALGKFNLNFNEFKHLDIAYKPKEMRQLFESLFEHYGVTFDSNHTSKLTIKSESIEKLKPLGQLPKAKLLEYLKKQHLINELCSHLDSFQREAPTIVSFSVKKENILDRSVEITLRVSQLDKEDLETLHAIVGTNEHLYQNDLLCFSQKIPFTEKQSSQIESILKKYAYVERSHQRSISSTGALTTELSSASSTSMDKDTSTITTPTSTELVSPRRRQSKSNPQIKAANNAKKSAEAVALSSIKWSLPLFNSNRFQPIRVENGNGYHYVLQLFGRKDFEDPDMYDAITKVITGAPSFVGKTGQGLKVFHGDIRNLEGKMVTASYKAKPKGEYGKLGAAAFPVKAVDGHEVLHVFTRENVYWRHKGNS